MQCIEYVEDSEYLDNEERRDKLNRIAFLARELKDSPLEVVPEGEREETEGPLPSPFLRRNSKFGRLEDLAGEYLEKFCTRR